VALASCCHPRQTDATPNERCHASEEVDKNAKVVQEGVLEGRLHIFFWNNDITIRVSIRLRSVRLGAFKFFLEVLPDFALEVWSKKQVQ